MTSSKIRSALQRLPGRDDPLVRVIPILVPLEEWFAEHL